MFRFGDKDKNNRCLSVRLSLLEKYKAIGTKTEDLKNIDLNALPVYDHRYIKTKIRTYGDKVCTNLCNLNVPEDDTECEPFTVILY